MTKGMGTLTIATRLQNTVLCFYELCALPSYSHTTTTTHAHAHAGRCEHQHNCLGLAEVAARWSCFHVWARTLLPPWSNRGSNK